MAQNHAKEHWIVQTLSFQHWEHFPLLCNLQVYTGLQHPSKVRDPSLMQQGEPSILVQVKKNVFGVSGCLAPPQGMWTPELQSQLLPVCFSHQQEQSGQPFTNDSHFTFYAQLSWAAIRQLSTALCRKPSPSSGGCCHWCQLAMLVPCHGLVPVKPSQTLPPTPFSPEL